MMQPPRHVLLELDEDGDLHSVDGDSDAPAVVGAMEGDSPPAPARSAIAGAVPVADPTSEELDSQWQGSGLSFEASPTRVPAPSFLRL